MSTIQLSRPSTEYASPNALSNTTTGYGSLESAQDKVYNSSVPGYNNGYTPTMQQSNQFTQSIIQIDENIARLNDMWIKETDPKNKAEILKYSEAFQAKRKEFLEAQMKADNSNWQSELFIAGTISQITGQVNKASTDLVSKASNSVVEQVDTLKDMRKKQIDRGTKISSDSGSKT